MDHDAREPDRRDRPPILAVDVDGVISLFGFEDPLEVAHCEHQLIDGITHCISLAAGDRLRRLAADYELVWATGWEDRANDHLPQLLGLAPMPFLTFDGNARFGTAHWKLPALERYAGARPLAWIDDSLDSSCYDWAAARSSPTLLVPTEPHLGLEEAHVDALIAWARSG